MDKLVEVIHLRLPPFLKELLETRARQHVQSLNMCVIEMLSRQLDLEDHQTKFNIDRYCSDKFNPSFFDPEEPNGRNKSKK